MKKLFLGAAVIILGVSFCIFLATRTAPRKPVWITLPDGSSAGILAVTYGTNHVVGSALGRVAQRLPDWLHDLLPDMLLRHVPSFQTMVTAEPELVVWLDRRTNSAGMPPQGAGYCTVFLADQSNFISGEDSFLITWPAGVTATLDTIPFKVFPRREKEITLKIFNHRQPGGVTNCGSLTFANPVYRSYPEWKPEPLPATKRAGDVEVTLLGLETGHGNNSSARSRADGTMEVTYNTDRSDGRNNTAVNLTLRPLTNTNEVWQVANEEVSDATGNKSKNSGMSWSGGDSFAFSPGLWPGEAAWKIKLEIKRNRGFHPDEMFTFKNVPLGELDRTNFIGWTTNFAGVTVTLQQISRRAPNTNASWSTSDLTAVKFTTSGLPAGTYLDLFKVMLTPGKRQDNDGTETSDNEQTYFFREIPLKANTADFTFAVHQSRTVEFTVKPGLPPVNQNEKNSTTDGRR